MLYNGLADALASLAADSAIPVELEVSIPVRPTPAIETIAYFCAAELLANAVKHSGAKRVEVQVTEQSNEVHLLVRDSGSGFDMEAVKGGSGLGLLSMQERVRLVNGAISFESKPMGGTTIRVSVPFKSEHAARRAAG